MVLHPPSSSPAANVAFAERPHPVRYPARHTHAPQERLNFCKDFHILEADGQSMTIRLYFYSPFPT